MIEIETWIAVAVVILPGLAWVIRRYLVIMADGIVTLTELLESVVDAIPVINSIVDDVEEIIEEDDEE